MKTNIRRTTVLAVAAATALGVVAIAASPAHALPGLLPDGRQKMARRVVMRRVELIVRAAQPTPEQLARINAARDRVLQTLQANRPPRGMRKQLAQAFGADKLDTARLEQLMREQQARQQAAATAMLQALREIHAVLTPAQRQAVAQQLATAPRFGKGRFGRRGGWGKGRFGGQFPGQPGDAAPEAVPQ